MLCLFEKLFQQMVTFTGVFLVQPIWLDSYILYIWLTQNTNTKTPNRSQHGPLCFKALDAQISYFVVIIIRAFA